MDAPIPLDGATAMKLLIAGAVFDVSGEALAQLHGWTSRDALAPPARSSR